MSNTRLSRRCRHIIRHSDTIRLTVVGMPYVPYVLAAVFFKSFFCHPTSNIPDCGAPPQSISDITLHYIRKLFIVGGLSKSNFKDHYGDVIITQRLGKIAEINEFSASDEML